MRGVFVHGEARPIGRELEEHAARLLEVDRLEPEAVDDRRGMRTVGNHLIPHVHLMRVVIHAPREMVDAADPPPPASLGWRLANVDHTGGTGKAVARPAVLLADALKPQRAFDERRG